MNQDDNESCLENLMTFEKMKEPLLVFVLLLLLCNKDVVKQVSNLLGARFGEDSFLNLVVRGLVAGVGFVCLRKAVEKFGKKKYE
jgi:uncharacterized membrane protein